jgi:hypothetical protein
LIPPQNEFDFNVLLQKSISPTTKKKEIKNTRKTIGKSITDAVGIGLAQVAKEEVYTIA